MRAYAEQDAITRLWIVKRGSRAVSQGMSKHEADNMVRTLNANDNWLEAQQRRNHANPYWRASRGG